MSKRLLTLLGVAGLVAVVLIRAATSADPPASPQLGRKLVAFALQEPRDQKTVSLADLKDQKAVVVIFMGTECPINNAFLPPLAQMHQDYAAKGVQFLAVNANSQDTPDAVAAHARKHEIPFPVLKDDGKVLELFGAQRTPEVFVLDRERAVRYQGRIDDRFGYGYKRAQPTRCDLAEALDELLAGKAVSVPSTPVAGCVISRGVQAKADGPVTYAKHVSRILQKHCQECHRPGQIGPFSLWTYKQAAAWSETIREAVGDGRMPPWHADPKHGKFLNDRSMSAEDKATLLAWVEQGCPKGDDKDLPPPREFSSEWAIGKPDVVVHMPEAYDVPAEAPRTGIPYKYFTVETNFTEDKWVAAAEARPDATAVVHHIIVFVVPPKLNFNQNDPRMKVLCGTAPGDMPFVAPAGMAKKVPAGSKLVFQMHYTPNGKAQTDKSSVGLVFAKGPVERQVLTLPILNPRINIPPGDDNYRVESQWLFEEDFRVLSFMPHMHLRGKDFLYEAVLPDGRTETLLAVPRYNFNWQSVYRCAEPVRLPKGTRIHCVAHFDNSAKNPNNPDPNQRVRWGDQTWEEMMIGWIDFVYERPAK